MSYKTLERLERLRALNSNKQWVNHDVYRLMYKEDLYMLAYERIKTVHSQAQRQDEEIGYSLREGQNRARGDPSHPRSHLR
jgi:hypothetical protein